MRNVKRRGFLAWMTGLTTAAGRGGEADEHDSKATRDGDSALPGSGAETLREHLPPWVAALPLWQWYEIPGTALSSVDPRPTPPGMTGPSAKIDAWCGASLKRHGSVYMIGAAGGHADYAGNEVDALALSVSHPAWEQLHPPSPGSDIINQTQFYLDRRPSSAHTYYASQFVDRLNRMVLFASQGIAGAFPKAPPGFPFVGDRRSASFDVGAGEWDSPDYIAPFPGSGDFTACLCVKHPLTGDVYYSRNYGDGWYQWTPSANRWLKLSAETRSPWYAGAAIDPTRQRMLVVGGYSQRPPEVRNLDGSIARVLFGGLGAESLTVAGYPGVIYDESLDIFVVLHNSEGKIRTLRVDARNWRVDAPRMSGDVPAARMNGILNSVQFVPELRGFVVANRHAGNVLFVRTST